MGVRRCLARSLTSLALLRTPKSANGPRSNSFRPDSPSTTTSNRGRKTQTAPLTTPDMVRSGRVLQTSVKSSFQKQNLIRQLLRQPSFYSCILKPFLKRYCRLYVLPCMSHHIGLSANHDLFFQQHLRLFPEK